MASKKKDKGPSMQLGFLLPSKPIQDPHLPTRTTHNDDTSHRTTSLPSVSAGSTLSSESADLDLESFDDYDDSGHVDGTTRLRLLDPPRDAPTVIVEAVGDVFEVSRLRDNGTTVACVMWTRKELEELQRRIVAALET